MVPSQSRLSQRGWAPMPHLLGWQFCMGTEHLPSTCTWEELTFTLGSTESQSLSDSALCREIPGAPASLCRTSAPDGYRRKTGSSCSTVLKTALLAYCECCGNFNFKIMSLKIIFSVCVCALQCRYVHHMHTVVLPGKLEGDTKSPWM